MRFIILAGEIDGKQTVPRDHTIPAHAQLISGILELGTSVPGFDSRNERGRAARDAYPLAFSYM